MGKSVDKSAFRAGKPLSRRGLLVGALCAASALALPLHHLAPEHPLRRFLARISPGLYSLPLGRQFARGAVAGLDAHELHARLLQKLSCHGGGCMDEPLRASIRRDALNERTLLAEGWVLPETAVYLSALAARIEDDVC